MAYDMLARVYDSLMSHVDYERWADIMLPHAGGAREVLDLACGTGCFTEILCRRGYDVVAVDISEDMLAAARGKGIPALFLQQDMARLDLYGTVGAAFGTMDSLNHLIKPRDLQKTLGRVSLFLEPGGVFIFDMLSENALRERDGKSFSTESGGAFCVWRSVWEAPLCRSRVTLFSMDGNKRWRREDETHAERGYTQAEVRNALSGAGFPSVEAYDMFTGRPAGEKDERILYVARKP